MDQHLEDTCERFMEQGLRTAALRPIFKIFSMHFKLFLASHHMHY